MFDLNANRKANQQAMSIRAKLFQQGQMLERAATKAKHVYQAEQSPENRMKLIYATSQLDGYVVTRSCITPTISADQALRSQEGLVNTLRRELNI